jgi:hypothetical protein
MVMGNVADPVDLIDLARSMVCVRGVLPAKRGRWSPGVPHVDDIGALDHVAAYARGRASRKYAER